MNYYPHHIGDFRSGSIHMTRVERWIYRDMIEVYYDTEKPLPLDMDELCNVIGARTEEERKIVTELLRYKFQKTEDGFRKARCDDEIAAYRAKAETAKANGRLGGRPTKSQANAEKPSGFRSGSDPVSTGYPKQTGSQTNQEPVTKNQEPTTRSKTTARATPSASLELPEWLPESTWSHWEEHRIAIKAPLTQRAAELCIAKLDKLRAIGQDPQAVIEQSVMSGKWTDLYAVKVEQPHQQHAGVGNVRPTKFDPSAYVNSGAAYAARNIANRNDTTFFDVEVKLVEPSHETKGNEDGPIGRFASAVDRVAEPF